MKLNNHILPFILISVVVSAGLTVSRSPLQFLQSDMIAYKSASQIFFDNGDPYSFSEVLARQRNMGLTTSEPLMVWNPPSFFSLFGLLLSLSFAKLSFIWQSFSIVAAFLLLLTGGSVCKSSNDMADVSATARVGYLSLALFLCFPVLVELYFLQISLVLGGILCLGIILFFQHYFFLSGLALSTALIKPHLAILPMMLLALWVLKERRFPVMWGALTGLAVSFLAAEATNPGIAYKWLFRDSWPNTELGSSTTSLLIALNQRYQLFEVLHIQVAAPLIGIVLFIFWRGRRLLTPNPEELLIAAACSPLVTPYGFTFDQIVLVPVVGYLACKALHHSEISRLRMLAAFSVITAIAMLCSRILITTVPLSWYIYPPLVLILLLSLPSNRGEGLGSKQTLLNH